MAAGLAAGDGGDRGFGEGAEDAPATIELPAELDRWKQKIRRGCEGADAGYGREFTKWFARGYAAIGVRKTGGHGVFVCAVERFLV